MDTAVEDGVPSPMDMSGKDAQMERENVRDGEKGGASLEHSGDAHIAEVGGNKQEMVQVKVSAVEGEELLHPAGILGDESAEAIEVASENHADVGGDEVQHSINVGGANAGAASEGNHTGAQDKISSAQEMDGDNVGNGHDQAKSRTTLLEPQVRDEGGEVSELVERSGDHSICTVTADEVGPSSRDDNNDRSVNPNGEDSAGDGGMVQVKGDTSPVGENASNDILENDIKPEPIAEILVGGNTAHEQDDGIEKTEDTEVLSANATINSKVQEEVGNIPPSAESAENESYEVVKVPSSEGPVSVEQSEAEVALTEPDAKQSENEMAEMQAIERITPELEPILTRETDQTFALEMVEVHHQAVMMMRPSSPASLSIKDIHVDDDDHHHPNHQSPEHDPEVEVAVLHPCSPELSSEDVDIIQVPPLRKMMAALPHEEISAEIETVEAQLIEEYRQAEIQPLIARHASPVKLNETITLPSVSPLRPRSASKFGSSMSHISSPSHVHIARIPSPPSRVKAQMLADEERRASTRMSGRLPPSVMKMSTVMVSARKKAEKSRQASVYYEEKQHRKVLTLDEAINSRPPMPFDLDGPGPCHYSPRNKPLYEDNAPEFTFGTKFPERAGGGRTAFAKTWFNSPNNFTIKSRYERRWPSPSHYGLGKSMLGRKIPNKTDFPAFSIGVRTKFSISKRGSEDEPSPNQYQCQRSDPLLYKRAPAFTMGCRLDRERLFGVPEATPSPNHYSPRIKYTSRKVHSPAFTIQGVRKPKSHALGPHATL